MKTKANGQKSGRGGAREGGGRPRRTGARPTAHLGPFLGELAAMRKALPENAEDFIQLVLCLRDEIATVTARAGELAELLSSVDPPALRQAALMVATLPQRVELTRALVETAGLIQKSTHLTFPWGDSRAARRRMDDELLGELLVWPHGGPRT
jgi:hypothetical protein